MEPTAPTEVEEIIEDLLEDTVDDTVEETEEPANDYDRALQWPAEDEAEEEEEEEEVEETEAPERDEVAQFIDDHEDDDWKHLRAIIRHIGWDPAQVTDVSEGYGEGNFEGLQVNNPDGTTCRIILIGVSKRTGAYDIDSELNEISSRRWKEDEAEYVPRWLSDVTGLDMDGVSTRHLSLSSRMEELFHDWCESNAPGWDEELAMGNTSDSGVADSFETETEPVKVYWAYWEE